MNALQTTIVHWTAALIILAMLIRIIADRSIIKNLKFANEAYIQRANIYRDAWYAELCFSGKNAPPNLPVGGAPQVPMATSCLCPDCLGI